MCAPLTSAPLEVEDLSVSFVTRVHTAQLKPHAVALQLGMDPAGGLTRLEDVGDRRKINQVNSALVLPDIPGMSVPENIRFDMFS